MFCGIASLHSACKAIANSLIVVQTAQSRTDERLSSLLSRVERVEANFYAPSKTDSATDSSAALEILEQCRRLAESAETARASAETARASAETARASAAESLRSIQALVDRHVKVDSPAATAESLRSIQALVDRHVNVDLPAATAESLRSIQMLVGEATRSVSSPSPSPAPVFSEEETSSAQPSSDDDVACPVVQTVSENPGGSAELPAAAATPKKSRSGVRRKPAV